MPIKPLQLESSTTRTEEQQIPILDSNYVLTPVNGLGAVHPAQPGADNINRARAIREARARGKQVRGDNRDALYAAREKALYAENAAYWKSINPEWFAHGPERILVSRGSARAHLGAVDLGAGSAAGLAVGSILVGGLVTFGMTYLACRLAMKKK
jgi:hypothetical protein